jgi:signal transduction histidine kinase
MKKILYYINSFFNFSKNKISSKEYREQREDFIGKRKIDLFRRSIIKYRVINEIIQYTTNFLKEFLNTENIGFYYWKEDEGHYVDYKEYPNYQNKIQIFDTFILVLSEYDLIFLKRNIDLIRNEEHKKIILNFLEQKEANILIPLILNESILGFIYANSPKYINISDYFILDELRYFVIIALSNSLIYNRLENLLKNLEEKIKERTKELEQAQKSLIQQEKMATLGTMIAGIAHEFNTPVGVIQASSLQVIKYFEHLIEIFFFKKDFRKLPDEFMDILYYFIYHLTVSKGIIQTKLYKLKKQLKDFFNKNQIKYDENLINFLIDTNLYKGNDNVFNNQNNLIHKIIKLYQNLNEEDKILMLDILKFLTFIYENLERIHHSANNIHKLVQSLRNYSRSSKNELLNNNIITIIENTLSLLENTLKHKVQIQKEFHYLGNLICDSNQIQQVLINLIMNSYQALKSCQKDNPLIKIVTKELNQDLIEIQIIDNGPGIPEEIQQQVWDPFFTTKPQGEGTGLGLGIVKNIIENHNGNIYFKSNPNGTTFFIQLPKKQPNISQKKSHPSLKYGRYDWR